MHETIDSDRSPVSKPTDEQQHPSIRISGRRCYSEEALESTEFAGMGEKRLDI